MTQDWSHATAFAAEPSSVSGARTFVSTHLLTHDLACMLDDVQLVVSELATNAMVHADTRFTVMVQRRSDAVRLEVQDRSSERPVLVAARELDTGGRGVAIVDAVTRAWGVDAGNGGGKTVWAEFEAC